MKPSSSNKESCYKCKGKMNPAVDIFFWKGKSYPMDVMKCVKCGEWEASLEESERVRKLIHPTLFQRISHLFNHTQDKVSNFSFFKGKIL